MLPATLHGSHPQFVEVAVYRINVSVLGEMNDTELHAIEMKNPNETPLANERRNVAGFNYLNSRLLLKLIVISQRILCSKLNNILHRILWNKHVSLKNGLRRFVQSYL